MSETHKTATPTDMKPVKELRINGDEKKWRDSDLLLFSGMQEERDKPYAELDGMTPIQYYESNRKKDLAFIPPKKNKHDVRISSGVTRDKGTTLLSTMLSMDFEPDVTAFDTDAMEVHELGDHMADLHKKSREIENWNKKRSIVYRELISQGDVFLLEYYHERYEPIESKNVSWNPAKNKISEYDHADRRLKKVFSECSVRMVNVKKVYVKDVHTEYIEDQGAVVIVNVCKRSTSEATYGTWDRWQNVPYPTQMEGLETIDGAQYKSFGVHGIGNDEVAEIMLFDKDNQRFQIYLNGVPMLPYNYALKNVSPSGDIPLSQGKLEPISGFYLSKSLPSKTKIEDEVLSEATTLMIEGMRQGRKPPMGTTARKATASNLFIAGNVTPDVKKGQYFPLIENPGLNAADFSFYKLIRDSIDEKTVNSAYSGAGASSGDPTATQVQQEKEQQMLKIGLAIDGVINLERRMTWLRIYNVLTHWTKKYDPHMSNLQAELYGQYRKFSVNTNVDGGNKGKRIIRFAPEGKFPEIHDMLAEEKALSDTYNTSVRVSYLDPENLRAMKYSYFIVVNATSKTNDMLTQVLFVQNVRQAMELFGPDALNLDYVKQRYATVINESYNKFFKKVDIMDMLHQGQEQGGMSTDKQALSMTARKDKGALRPVVE